jgi:hypothetical protein
MLTANSPEKAEAEHHDVVAEVVPKYRTRDLACKHIREKHGIPLSESTADKLAALGEFARVSAYWGRRPLYADADLDAWVETRLRRDNS